MDELLDHIDAQLLEMERNATDNPYDNGFKAALKSVERWIVGKNHEDYSETIGVHS
jgi:hypothetical protein